MNYIMRRTIQLIAVSLLLPFWPAGDADAVFESALRGDYDVTLTRTCMNETPSGSAVPPIGPFMIRGTETFNGDGTGSFTGQVRNPFAAAIAGTGISTGSGNEIYVTDANESCSITYSVNADGSFTETLNCNLTNIQGGPPPPPGQTETVNGISLRGQIAHDGTVLIMSTTPASLGTVETRTVTSGTIAGTTQKRICATEGVATARR